jgi:hypothetical protein
VKLLLGRITEIFYPGIELTDLSSLLSGKPSFRVCLKGGYLDFARTTSLFFLNVNHEGKRYFKFENLWLKSESFVDRVK